MFLPLRTDRRLLHTPWMNCALIAVNILLFMATQAQVQQVFLWMAGGYPYEAIASSLPVARYMLWGHHLTVEQFVSYQFLHADWMHLLGNMLFLYVFGNSLEDRLGPLGYLGFYLAGGVLAAAGHVLIEGGSHPVLGASGSVCAVTGAYLALFPLSNVTIVYFLILVGLLEVPSIYLILLQVAQNLVMRAYGSPGVAYVAHLAGYAFGFLAGMGLLWTRLLPREPYDLLALMERRRRRRAFESLTRTGYNPWESPPPPAVPGEAAAEPTAAERQIMQLRARVHAALARHDLEEASKAYRLLLEVDAQQVLGMQHQHDLANQLMAEGDYPQAAHAYELFLSTHTGYPQRQEVELILGLIYARYVNRPQRAAELLRAALPKLADPEHQALAQQLLAQLAR